MYEKLAIGLIERGLIPDSILRASVRHNLYDRLRCERRESPDLESEQLMRFVAECDRSPLAIVPEQANQQHYEVPAEFYVRALGPHLKYSSCLYLKPEDSLADAEANMLALTCERSELADGQQVLELGCGWGSLTLYMAARFPRSRITSVSNSASQRDFIMSSARERGLNNVEVITADMNDFSIDRRFDRVVSVEMFEHMRNHRELLRRIRGWISDQGRLFIHIFTHKHYSYFYETTGLGNWLGRYFFSGGMMPSDTLLLYYQEQFSIEKHWRVSGEHYSRTARDWLNNIDRKKNEVIEVFERTYGPGQGQKHFNRWRLFFISCEELWGFRGGNEWFVSHYRFKPRI